MGPSWWARARAGACLLGLLGCQSPATSRSDAAVAQDASSADAASIDASAPDAPSVADALSIDASDVGTSASDTGADAGPPIVCATVTFTHDTWPPLPAACLPRCTSASRAGYDACMSSSNPSCLTNALASDPTPDVLVDDGSGTTILVHCHINIDGPDYSCVAWQLQSAMAENCPTEFGNFHACYLLHPTDYMRYCGPEMMAFSQCQIDRQSEIQARALQLQADCFPP